MTSYEPQWWHALIAILVLLAFRLFRRGRRQQSVSAGGDARGKRIAKDKRVSMKVKEAKTSARNKKSLDK